MIGVNNKVNDRVKYEGYKRSDRVKVQQHDRAYCGWSLRQDSAHDHMLRSFCNEFGALAQQWMCGCVGYWNHLYVRSLSICSTSCWLTLGLTGSQLYNRLRDYTSPSCSQEQDKMWDGACVNNVIFEILLLGQDRKVIVRW